jgi:lincosamide nucleotidyltransferase A/C/D/E
MGNNLPEITARDLIEIVQLFVGVASPCENRHGIEVYLDGGWGVDALLGEQTGTHADLDIAVQHKDSPQIRALLTARGYGDVCRDDSSDFNFVIGSALFQTADPNTILTLRNPMEN